MKVLFSVPIKEKEIENFKMEFPEIKFIKEKDQPREQLLKDIDVWITYGFDIKGEDIKLAGQLKWIMVYSAGVDQLPAEEIAQRDILVTNVRGIHRHAMAEQVFAYMLSHVRKLNELFIQQKNGEWSRKVGAQSLYGKTIGIIGVGAIGQEIARKAKAFDMKVLGIRKSTGTTEFVDETYPIEELHKVLKASDFVVMVLPATGETKHIMNKEAFEQMKEDGYFINIARGEVVDTQALLWALQEEKIAGAAVDVFEEEPLPKDHPLRALRNIIITPHTAGLFPDYISRSNVVFNQNLRVYIKNIGEMINVVDVKKGY